MKTWLAFAVALLFIIGAAVGSYITSQHMEETAMETGSSAGDNDPNTNQQQEQPPARAPSTTGSGSQDLRDGGSVPPASR
jgi:hypothetical protein